MRGRADTPPGTVRKTMKYFSMFSGIGTGEKGIEQAFDYQPDRHPKGPNTRSARDCIQYTGGTSGPSCIGFSEIDKYAEAIYRYHYPEHHNYGDATTIDVRDLPDFDFCLAGFPCQSFSIAGKRKGFNDTRGTLFFEVARILRGKRPPHFLLENVKGLLSHNDGNTFATIIATLDEIGYDIEWTVCNSKHFGVPQNRERVFIVGHLRGRCGRKVLPIGGGYEEVDADVNGADYIIGSRSGRILENQSTASTLTGGCKGDGNHSDMDLIVRLTAQDQHGVTTGELKQIGNVDTLGHNSIWGRVYDPDGISATLNSEGGGMGAKTGLYLHNARIRRLTPTECERLQGLPDGWTEYGRFGDEVGEISDTQRYKGLGNAFTVNVIEWLMTQLIEGGCVE